MDSTISSETSDISDPQQEPKTTRTKRSEESKTLEKVINEICAKPFKRRLSRLYSGLNVDNCEVFGNEIEEDIAFGNPDQSLALVLIKDPEYKTIFDNWKSYFLIDPNVVEIVNIINLISLCNKVSWNLQRLSPQRDPKGCLFVEWEEKIIKLSEPVFSLFAYRELSRSISIHGVLLQKTHECFDIPFVPEKKNNVGKITIPYDTIKTHSMFEHFTKSFSIIYTLGIDSLSLDHISDPQSFLKFYPLSPFSLVFGHVLLADNYEILIFRPYVFLMSQ